MLSFFALGFTSGFLLSISPDSGTMEAVNKGIQRGFLSSFMVGLGGVAGDIFCFCALILGFTFYFESYPSLKFYTLVLCFSFLFLAGIYNTINSRFAGFARLRKKTNFIVIWFENPFIFGFASSLLTPATTILTAPFFGMLIKQCILLEVAEMLAGFTLGGVLWSALLGSFSAIAGHKLNFNYKELFRKTAGLFYIITGAGGIYLLLMEMIST